MADITLKTDYKDDVLDTSVNTQRKYQMIQNGDGTVSFVDVTEYSQIGDSFGAADVNAINNNLAKTNEDVSALNSNINTLNNEFDDFLFRGIVAGNDVVSPIHKNMNDAVEVGAYNYSYSPANAPGNASNKYGVLFVFGGLGYRVQLAIQGDDASTYVRFRAGETWTAWRPLT